MDITIIIAIIGGFTRQHWHACSEIMGIDRYASEHTQSFQYNGAAVGIQQFDNCA